MDANTATEVAYKNGVNRTLAKVLKLAKQAKKSDAFFEQGSGSTSYKDFIELVDLEAIIDALYE